MLTKSVAEKLEQGTKAVLEKAKVRNDLTHEVNLEPTDTPGVAILGAANPMQAASVQRSPCIMPALKQYYARIPTARLSNLLGRLSHGPLLNDEIIAIRDKHKMLFEAVIWAQLFGFARDENIIRATGGFSNLKLVGVTDTLVDYWRHRFARVITEWVVSRLRANDWNAGRLQLSEGIATFGGEFGNLPRDEQVSQVNRFFMEVACNLGTLAAQGIGKGSINVTQPPIPKK